MFGDVLAVHDRLTVCGVVPVPVSVSVVLVGCALLVKVSVPPATPDTCGLKVTVNEALWPAGIVIGSGRPPTLNTELFALAAVTVTFAPLAVRLPDAVPLLPTTTLPRPRVVGVTESCPLAAEPVPDSGMTNVGLDAFEETVTLPLTLPVDCGANATLKVALCPAVSVSGAVIPFRL